MTQPANACVSETGGLCLKGYGLGDATAVAVSPDGRDVYAASSNHSAVPVFDREQPPVPTPEAPALALTPASPPAVVTGAPKTPTITAFTASPRRLRASSSTRLRLTLSAPATVRITLERRGRTLRTLTVRPGIRSLRLSGRHRKPGRYVARAAVAGSARTLGLVVLRA